MQNNNNDWTDIVYIVHVNIVTMYNVHPDSSCKFGIAAPSYNDAHAIT